MLDLKVIQFYFKNMNERIINNLQTNVFQIPLKIPRTGDKFKKHHEKLCNAINC